MLFNKENQKIGNKRIFRVVLVWAYRGLTGWVSFAQEFQCCYFCESSCLFYLSFNFDFYVSKIMHYELGIFQANQTTKCLRNQGKTKGEGWSTAN